jgi:hypothetical protein
MLIRGRAHRRAAAASALVLAVCAGLVGCGGGDDDSNTEPDPSSGLVGGVTAPGTALRLGEAATVALAHGGRRSNVEITVEKVQHGAVKDLREFDLNAAARKSGVYYVRASVRNLGNGSAGGAFVTLYGRVSDTLVVQPVIFGSTFGKCDYKPLPKPFGPGKRADVCLVMLAPSNGTISAVEWRFAGQRADDPPISWELS